MTTRKRKPRSVATSIERSATRYFFNEGNLSSLFLSPHDINIISIVSQKPNVEAEELMRLVKESNVSKNAIDIVNLMLKSSSKKKYTATQGSDKKSTAKRAIANNYMLWAQELAGNQERSGTHRKASKSGRLQQSATRPKK